MSKIGYVAAVYVALGFLLLSLKTRPVRRRILGILAWLVGARRRRLSIAAARRFMRWSAILGVAFLLSGLLVLGLAVWHTYEAY